jgi:hypothetical protein
VNRGTFAMCWAIKNCQQQRDMDSAIVVAVITVIGGVLVALIQQSRKDNSRDHAAVVDGIKRIETKIDTHLLDHTRKNLKRK